MGHYCYDTRRWVDDEIDPSITSNTDWDGAPRRDCPGAASGLWPADLTAFAQVAKAAATTAGPIPTERRAE